MKLSNLPGGVGWQAVNLTRIGLMGQMGPSMQHKREAVLFEQQVSSWAANQKGHIDPYG